MLALLSILNAHNNIRAEEFSKKTRIKQNETDEKKVFMDIFYVMIFPCEGEVHLKKLKVTKRKVSRESI